MTAFNAVRFRVNARARFLGSKILRTEPDRFD
jgi:hypothetical protein